MNKKTEKSFNLSKSRNEILELRKSLLNLRFQKSSGQLEKTSEIKKTRKNIARIKQQITNYLGEKNA